MPHPSRRQLLAAAAAAAATTATGPWACRAQAQTAPPDPMAPRPLVFPRDHGSHNDTRTEWWYLTGHAADDSGRPFGFQITFFRSRVDAAQRLEGRLAARQLLFAHAAITDVRNARLRHDQRIARWNGEPPAVRDGGVWADTQDLHVVLRDWSLQRRPDGGYRTRAAGEDLGIELEADPTQPLLMQGSQGFSRKGPDPAQASFYVSHPQLAVRGELRLGDERLRVQGRAWLDHEWSEALLHPEAVGWDWIGMNLDDGSSLTAFRLRRADGSALWAGGSWRATPRAGGATRAFGPDEVVFTPQRRWTSPLTRASYPVAWRVQTPAGVFGVRAQVDPQELDSRQSTGTVYWEGLSDLLDARGRRLGQGYLEMTGYAQALRL